MGNSEVSLQRRLILVLGDLNTALAARDQPDEDSFRISRDAERIGDIIRALNKVPRDANPSKLESIVNDQRPNWRSELTDMILRYFSPDKAKEVRAILNGDPHRLNV